MRCVRCGSERLARLGVIGHGTSRRYLVGCGACRKVFRSARDPGTRDLEPQMNADKRRLGAGTGTLEPGIQNRQSKIQNRLPPGPRPLPIGVHRRSSAVSPSDPFDEVGARLEAEVERTRVLTADLLARFYGLGLMRASDLPSPPRISDEDYARAIAAAAR